MAALNADIINNEERAYVLGWIALVGDKAPDALKHREAEWIRNTVGEYTSLKDVSERLKLKAMPEWLCKKPDLGWAFVRGYFDHHGQISEPESVPVCKLYGAVDMLSSIADFVSIPVIRIGFGNHGDNKKVKPLLIYKGTNVIDFLGTLYDRARIFWAKRRSQYFDLLSADTKRVPHVYYTRALENAVVPSKAHPSDVGYDLTIVAEHKKINSVTTLYDTGIKVRVDNGYYAEVVPRSSIVKSGYMLTNGQGIIDPSYQGNIYVALTKVAPEAEPIQLPFRGFQIIIRRQHHAIWTEGNETETARKDGGFGSSGN
jgi:deoxyuridine 5'-triphosphate nucleotidohydrolase